MTPGANTDGDLSNSRTSEPALLTPLTPSSRSTPDEDGIKNDFANFSFNSPQLITSASGSPSSPIDIDLSGQTPFRQKNGVGFTSPLQETPHLLEELYEGIPWETATPSLPERTSHKVESGLAEKGSISPGVNGLYSSSPYNISTPLLLSCVHMPNGASEVSSSKQTFSSSGGNTFQGEKIRVSYPIDHGSLRSSGSIFRWFKLEKDPRMMGIWSTLSYLSLWSTCGSGLSY